MSKPGLHRRSVACRGMVTLLTFYLLLAVSHPASTQTASSSGETILVFETPDPIRLSSGDGFKLVPISEFGKGVADTIAGAPYSGVAKVRWIYYLERNATFALRERTLRYFRDGRGRVRIEEVFPADRKPLDAMIRIDDPVSKKRYLLNVNDKSVRVEPFENPEGLSVQLPAKPPAPIKVSVRSFFSDMDGDRILTDGKVVSKTMESRAKRFDGTSLVNTRIEHTIPAQRNPIEMSWQQSFSPELGVVTMSDLRLQTAPAMSLYSSYQMDFERGEPDPALFKVPPEYN